TKLDASNDALTHAEADRKIAQPLQDAYAAADAETTKKKTDWDQAKAAMDSAQAEATAHDKTIASFLRDALAIQPQTEKASELLRGLAADVAKVGDKPMKSIDYTLDTTTVIIKAEKETKYASYLSPAAKQAQAAAKEATTVIIQPYRVATVRPGVAFVVG